LNCQTGWCVQIRWERAVRAIHGRNSDSIRGKPHEGEKKADLHREEKGKKTAPVVPPTSRQEKGGERTETEEDSETRLHSTNAIEGRNKSLKK